MEPLRFLVFGSNGMLGRYCCEYLRDQNIPYVAVTRAECDCATSTLESLTTLMRRVSASFDQPDAISKTPPSTAANGMTSSSAATCRDPECGAISEWSRSIRRVSTIVVNAAGIIRQRQNVSLATMLRVNGVFPSQLQQVSASFGYRLIHISTDCVFNGHSKASAGGGYVESDDCTETDEPYAVSKRLAEVLLQGTTASIVRTSIVGEETRNGFSLMQWLISSRGKTVPGFVNHEWNGVACLQLAKTIVAAARANLLWSGVRHVFTPGPGTSKFELLETINRIYDLRCRILPTTHATTHCKRLASEAKDTAALISAIPELKRQLQEQYDHSRKYRPGFQPPIHDAEDSRMQKAGAADAIAHSAPPNPAPPSSNCALPPLSPSLGDASSMTSEAARALGENSDGNLRLPSEVRSEVKNVTRKIAPRDNCRFCGAAHADLYEFLDLGSMPHAGGFLTDGKQAEISYRLRVHFCRRCALVQVLDVIPKEVLFTDYFYTSSVSRTLIQHAESFAATIAKMVAGCERPLVVEIGSNDGLLLAPLRELKIEAIGIEPAENMAKIARSRGLEVYGGFLSESTAKAVIAMKGGRQVDIIAGSNVLAHIDDMHEVARSVKLLLKPESGTLVFEVHHLLNLIGEFQYDMIYNEHLCYHSLTSLDKFFRSHGMFVSDAESIPIHAGSIRVYVKCDGANAPTPTDRLKTLLAKEATAGLSDERTFAGYAERVAEHRRQLLALLRELRTQKKRVVGYGASGRANTVLNYCGIGPDLIDCIADDSSRRQNTFTPGMHIPVVSPAFIRQATPPVDYILVLAWSYADEIVPKLRQWFTGRFIIPLPVVRTVS